MTRTLRNDSNSRRRLIRRLMRPRTSLRALLLFVAIAAFVLGFVTKQWRVASRLRSLDAELTYLYQYDHWDEPSRYRFEPNATLPGPLQFLGPDIVSTVVRVHSANSPDPATVAELTARLPHIRTVRILDSPLKDEDLLHLKSLTGLRGLHLCGTSITDRSVETLCQLRQLTVLNIRDTDLSERAIEDLKKSLPNTRVHVGKRQSGYM